MADARDSGAVQTAVRGAGSRYLGKYDGYAVSTKQSDRVPGVGRRTSIHQGPSTVRYCNTPKYTLVVFDMFRVFCKPNLTVS